MNDLALHAHHRNQEKTFHELLSKLVSQLPQLLSQTQKILALKHRREEYLHNEATNFLIQRLSDSNLKAGLQSDAICDIQALIPATSSIYRRFRSRLLQVVLPFKQRLESSKLDYSPLADIIKVIQKAIYDLQEGLSFGVFLQTILGQFTRFVEKQKQEQRSTDKPKVKSDVQVAEGGVNLSQDKTSVRRSFTVEPDYQKKLRKLVNILNVHFKTVSCLDLDYTHFRSCFFQGKNNGNSLYEEIIQRNKSTKAQITAYSKDFKEYLQRKQKRRFEKRASMMAQPSRNNSANRSFKLYRNSKNTPNEDDEKREFVKVNWASERCKTFSKTKPNKFSFTRSDFIELEEQPKKAQYQMKNIVICANSINVTGLSEVTQYTIKNTLKRLEDTKRRASRQDDPSFIRAYRQAAIRPKFQQ